MTFSRAVADSVGSVHFQRVPCSGYTSQGVQDPSYVVCSNYRVLIYFTCHFQSVSLCLF